MTDPFAAQPWQAWPDAAGSGPPAAWTKTRVPYVPAANALQYLDLWIPADGQTADTPPAASIPRRPGQWVVYIHGGAWRDPLVQAPSFAHTVQQFLALHRDRLGDVAGFASLNYSLSIHPHHPTLPNPPTDPALPTDPSRVAKHPQHIADVVAALAWLQARAGFAGEYVLLGHSCGATLALQVAADQARWGPARAAKPATLVGLNGLYDLPTLIRDPGDRHDKVRHVYEEFTRFAFGDDERVWRDASPVAVADWGREWPEGRKVVLVQSKEDGLVPYAQTEAMLAHLRQTRRDVSEMDAGGEHNDLWQAGRRLADIVAAVL